MSISNNTNSIPFLDLVTPHVEMEQELTAIFHQVLHTAGFIGGPMVEDFEKAFAAFCGTSHSIAVSSGTDALRFAIMACGVQPGDVVLTVPHTFIATTEAISQAGALPEFVDIDERTYNMDPEKLREYLGRKLEGVPRRCRMAADGIPTFQDFIQLLPDMTMIMLKRYRKYAPAHPPKGPAIERPRLRRADPADFGDAP